MGSAWILMHLLQGSKGTMKWERKKHEFYIQLYLTNGIGIYNRFLFHISHSGEMRAYMILTNQHEANISYIYWGIRGLESWQEQHCIVEMACLCSVRQLQQQWFAYSVV